MFKAQLVQKREYIKLKKKLILTFYRNIVLIEIILFYVFHTIFMIIKYIEVYFLDVYIKVYFFIRVSY